MPRCVPGLLLWMCWGLTSVAAVPQDTVVLQPGVPIDRRLTSDEAHVYEIRLTAGGYWRAVVEPQDIDLVLEAEGPDEYRLAVSRPSSQVGVESLMLAPEVSGVYCLIVRSLKQDVGPGSYKLQIEELSDTTPADRTRLAVETAMTDAARLFFQGTATARRDALVKYERALTHWRVLGSRRDEATTLHYMASVLSALGDTPQALATYREALALWQELGDRRGEGSALNNLGLAHSRMGESYSARPFLERALTIRRSIGDRLGEARTRNNLCLVAQRQAEWRRALACYEAALRLTREVSNAHLEALILSNIGGVYTNLGEPDRALDHYQQSLRLRRSIGDRHGEAQTLNNLGALYRSVGEAQEALQSYNRALEIFRQTESRYWQARTLNNIGYAYYSLGDWHRAKSFYGVALPLRREVGDRRGEAVTLNNLGRAYTSLEEWPKALDVLEQALVLRRDDKDRRGEANALDMLGRTYAAMGDFALALDHFEQALALRRQIGDRQGEAELLQRRGAVYMALGKPRPAFASLVPALELHQTVRNPTGEAQTLVTLARAERHLGRLSTAREHLEAALDIIESLSSRVDNPDLQASFLSSKRDAYELEIDLLMELHDSDPRQGFAWAALEVSERARARSLLDLLNEADADIRQGVDTVLREREVVLQHRLNAKTNRLMKILAGSSTEKQVAEAEAERYQTLADLEHLATEIRRRNPSYAALTQPRPLRVPAIQDLLDPETMLLEYSLGEDRSFLWVVTARSVASYELPGRETIETAARPFYEGLKTRDTSLEIRQRDQEAGQALSQLLLGHIAERLAGQRLVVVADGVLNYLPFGALPRPCTAAMTGCMPSPILFGHEVVSLPSASVLAVQRRALESRSPASMEVAVLADPVFDQRDPRVRNPTSSQARAAPLTGTLELERLPSTREEAEAIVALLPRGQVLTALDFAASRSLVLDRRLGEYRIVHLATHGLINARHPELSGLALSMVDEDGQLRDGFVRLHDLYNLELKADLVVLSGCQMALGKEVSGEGLVGLTRGFMYAGASRVVAGLWRVQDRVTAELMKRFYRSMLVERLRPAAALRAAQLSIKRERQWQDPYYWAPFVLQGDWR